MKIKLMLVIAIISAFSIFMAGCGSETKLGYVDEERVITEAPQIKAIEDDTKTKFEDLQKKATELEAKQSSMSEEDFKKEQMKLQRQAQGIQMQAQNKVKSALDKALDEIAKDKDLSAIVKKDTIVQNGMQMQKKEFVVHGGTDLTDDVIQKLQ